MVQLLALLAIALSAQLANAFSPLSGSSLSIGCTSPSHTARLGRTPSRALELNMVEFGKTFYKGFEDWCGGFAADQKDKFPAYFTLPEGVYEVELQKPLGIVFEEVEAGGSKGVFVSEVVPEGNAARSSIGIGVGDLLLACTGVKVRGAKFDRPLIQADRLDYDTVIMAIQSNEAKRGMDGPIMQFLKAGSPYPEEYINGAMRDTATPLDAR